jgi:hypothetical protein
MKLRLAQMARRTDENRLHGNFAEWDAPPIVAPE